MGVHPANWSVETVQLLKDRYAAFPELSQLPFDERIETVEICYDKVFEDIRTQWKDQSAAILKVMGDNGLDNDFIKKLVEAGQTPSEDNFLWTHVLDVLLYRFVPTVCMNVRVTVADQIMKRLDTGGEIPTWSVLAHSLGTSVAHDSLNDLYHTAVPGKSDLSLSTGDTSAELVMMVANVSKVLETTNVYTSYVRPSSITLPDRMCRYYFSVAHRRDPFTWFKPFDPSAPWPDATSAGNYKALVVRHVLDWNVHDLDHYLKGPQVHIPLFRYIAGPDCISEQEEADAIKKFVDEWQAGSWAKIDEVLENILPHQNGSWTELFSSLLKYGSLKTKV
jgi:hypothetical protein